MVYFNHEKQSNDVELWERKFAISYGGSAHLLGGGKPRVIGGRPDCDGVKSHCNGTSKANCLWGKAVRPALICIKKSALGRQVAENPTEI